ncbi:M48 family metalloprotease [Herbidospora sp. RD11066]
MTGDGGERAPRLNPFLLPSSTTSRFLILILTTVAGSLYVNLWLRTMWWSVRETPEHVRAASCLTGLRSGAMEDATAVLDRYAACAVRVTAIDSLIPVAMLAAPLLAVVVLYLLHPVWARRHGLDPLETVGEGPNHDAVVARFAAVVAEETPGKVVRVLVDPARRGVSGRTFGLPRRHTIVLSIGTVVAYRKEPQVAEAVLRHELAHIRNRDVGVAHLTVAIWWAFLVTEAVPAVVASVLWNPSLLPGWAIFLPVILLVLWSSRTAVLRAREHHADVRAGDTPDRREGMEAAVKRGDPLPWYRRLGNHPGPGRRAAVLADPGRLLRPGIGEMATTGLLAGLCFPPVLDAFAYVNFEAGNDVRHILPGILFGALLSGIALVGIWRAAAAGLMGGGTTLAAAAAMTTGLLAGLWFTATQNRGFWAAVFQAPLSAALMAAGLLLLLWLFLTWAKACATAWLPVAGGTRSITLVAVAVGAVVVGPWLGMWHQGTLLLLDVADGRQLVSILALFAARHPLFLFTIVLAAVFLVAAGARRARPARPLALFLDDVPPAPLRRAYSRFLAALVPAMGAAAVLAVAGFALQPWLAAETRAGRQLEAVYTLIGIAVALSGVAAVVIGVLTGGRRRTLWAAAHTTSALAVAGVPMALVVLGHTALAECGWARAASCYTQGGTFVGALGSYYTLTFAYALFPALVVTAVAGLVRSLRAGDDGVRAPRKWPLRAAAIAAVTVVGAAGATGAVTQWLPYIGAADQPPARWSPEIVEALRQPIRERSLPPLATCQEALSAHRGTRAGDVLSADQGYWLTVARLVNRIASADDDGLRIFAQAGYVWFGKYDADMVGRTVSRLAHYCTLTVAESAP